MGKITLYNNDRVVWSYEIGDAEMIAGMAAVSIPMLAKINQREDTEYLIDTDLDLSKFRQVRYSPENKISKISKLRFKYGIWLKSIDNYTYSLYSFNTNKFFQGIISMCVSFKMGFRPYMYGFPFDRNGVPHVLSGYVMNEDWRFGVVALDSDDKETNRDDDENLLVPLVNDVNL